MTSYPTEKSIGLGVSWSIIHPKMILLETPRRPTLWAGEVGNRIDTRLWSTLSQPAGWEQWIPNNPQVMVIFNGVTSICFREDYVWVHGYTHINGYTGEFARWRNYWIQCYVGVCPRDGCNGMCGIATVEFSWWMANQRKIETMMIALDALIIVVLGCFMDHSNYI